VIKEGEPAMPRVMRARQSIAGFGRSSEEIIHLRLQLEKAKEENAVLTLARDEALQELNQVVEELGQTERGEELRIRAQQLQEAVKSPTLNPLQATAASGGATRRGTVFSNQDQATLAQFSKIFTQSLEKAKINVINAMLEERDKLFQAAGFNLRPAVQERTTAPIDGWETVKPPSSRPMSATKATHTVMSPVPIAPNGEVFGGRKSSVQSSVKPIQDQELVYRRPPSALQQAQIVSTPQLSLSPRPPSRRSANSPPARCVPVREADSHPEEALRITPINPNPRPSSPRRTCI
jgi:hypothetical protein